MPANLTQQYHKAEQAYRRASSPDEELQCLQAMLRELPKHKGTDKLQAELKQKISRAKKDLEQQKGTARGPSKRIPRQGAGRAVLIGGPNCGKSQLMGALTRATPEVAPYPFTTREPAPGMMPWEDVLVQLIDTPPITKDLFDPTTQGLIRGAELVLLMADLGEDEGIDDLQQVLGRFADSKTRLADESYLDEDDVGVSYTKTFFVPNKIDLDSAADRLQMLHEFCEVVFRSFEISASESTGLEPLRNAIFQAMDVVRVYTKMPNRKDPDFDRPFTIRQGGTVLDVAELVHKDFAKSFKSARVWGEAVHDGVQVKGDYVLHDKDIVELHT